MHTKAHTHDTFPLCPLKFKNISLFSDPKPDSDDKIPVEHPPPPSPPRSLREAITSNSTVVLAFQQLMFQYMETTAVL